MVRVNPNYIKRYFSGNRNDQMEWYFSVNRKYAVIEDYEQFLFVHKDEAESAEFKQHRSIKGTDFLIEHPMDDEVKEFLSKLYSTRVPDPDKINVKDYRAFTFFKKFGKGSGSVENDCLRFAESLSIGKYPYRGSRSFMKDNITENLIGESYERNFQIANEIFEMITTKSPYYRSPYNRIDVYNNINSYADPEVGECYGMLSLWSPEKREAMPYHFGCVLFKDIDDKENLVSTITLEANVGNQSLQLPNFNVYDVGSNPLNTNPSFYTAWRNSFICSKHPKIKLNLKMNRNSDGETIVTKTPPPPPSATESYDKWGFLMKDGDYVLNDVAQYPIVVVAVPKNKNINPYVNIIPKPFEKESLTPKSPDPSPIKSPEKLPFIPSPIPRIRQRTAKPPKASAATAAATARTRRRSAATTRRQQGRTRTVRAARQTP